MKLQRLAYCWLALGCLGAAAANACGGTGNTPGDFGSGSPGGSGARGSSGGGGGGAGSGGGESGSAPVSSGANAENSGSVAGSSGGSGSQGGTGAMSSGSMDAGSASGSVSGSPTPGGPSPSPQYLPKVSGTCPSMKSGMAMFSGQNWQLWTGSGTGGPMIIYWHGTGGSPAEAPLVLGQATIDAVTKQGGIVAAGTTSTQMGSDITAVLKVWYTGDFDMADQLVACAIQELHIDTRRIYVSGGSAGGLMTGWMSYARSGYVAAVAPVSGGLTGLGGVYLDPVTMPQDKTNVPSALVTHGALGSDVVVIDFAQASAAYEADIKSKGGYSIDCNTGGGHVSGPPQISPAIWQFFQDHPFGVRTPEPTPLPAIFPSYCKVGPRAADGGAP